MGGSDDRNGGGALPALSAADMDRLGDLIAGYDSAARFGRSGVAPIDCGGSNGSDHSYRFTKLVKLGLAEHRKRGYEWGQAPGPGRGYRGSKVYRPTELGRKTYASRSAPTPHQDHSK